MKPFIIVNCGAGSRPDHRDGAEKAGKVGLEILQTGGNAIDAVELAVTILEDDIRFNAGTGSRMRLNGKIQMDAGIMDSNGRCGAVACIMNVKNPIKVARKVADTPHILLGCEGAEGFARKNGFEVYDPVTQKAMKEFDKVKARISTGELPRYAQDWKEFYTHWIGTVGAVARDKNGDFSVAVSTGGTSYMLDGRIGDSSLLGCGFYADRKGAVTATGIGEDIIRKLLSKWVYDRIEAGKSAQKAAESGVVLFEDFVPIGILAVSADGYGAACNREMAYWASDEG